MKKIKHEPQDINSPAMPEDIFSSKESSVLKPVDGQQDVPNPKQPEVVFNPKIQHNVKELQVGSGTSAFWATKKGGLQYPARTITDDITMFPNENVVFADAASDPISTTLPVGLHGKEVVVKKIDSSANPVTIYGVGTATIDGATSVVLSTQYSGKRMIFDSVSGGWFVVGSF